MALNGEREKYFGALLQREADAAEAVCSAPGAGAVGGCARPPEEVLHTLCAQMVVLRNGCDGFRTPLLSCGRDSELGCRTQHSSELLQYGSHLCSCPCLQKSLQRLFNERTVPPLRS